MYTYLCRGHEHLIFELRSQGRSTSASKQQTSITPPKGHSHPTLSPKTVDRQHGRMELHLLLLRIYSFRLLLVPVSESYNCT